MEASDRHRLSIIRVDLSERKPEGEQAWRTTVWLDGRRIQSNDEIYDPCSKEQHNAIKVYLEELLAREDDQRSTAAQTSKLLEDCRTCLFNQLLYQLNLHPLLSKKRILLDVCDDGGSAEAPYKDTIHCLPWELLESYDTPSTSITVRRTVAPAFTDLELERVCSCSTSDSINILLVVARDLSSNVSRGDDHSTPATPAILNARGKLSERQGFPKVYLEIVRPPTFQELRKRLEKMTKERGRGYFHIVHFDLHGYVKNHTPYLRFANESGTLSDVPASLVAELLSINGVALAVTNACKSATANEGVDANLALMFVRKNIDILAMSYKIPSSAAFNFLESFYDNFFVETHSFSEAAGKARKALRDQKERTSQYGVKYDIQDWIVPVVYSGNKDLQISPRASQLPRPLVGRRRSCSLYRYFMTFFSVIFTSLFSSRSLRGAERRPLLVAQAKCRPDMVCLQADTFDGGQAYHEPLVVDTFTLNIEHRLSNDHYIFLHGPPAAGKSYLLDQLSHYWISTGFTKRVYVIQARMFLQRGFPGPLRYLLHSIQGLSKFLYAGATIRHSQAKEESNFARRPIVIIDHMDQLFSDDLDLQQKAQAKARLDNFLSKSVGETRGVDYTQWPDLILVGRQGDEWLRKHFGDLDFDPTPIFLNSRPALHHVH